MTIVKYKIPSWIMFDDKNTEDFLNFVNSTLDIQDKYGIIFPLDEIDEIIKKLEEYYTFIDANKYNL